MSDGAVTVTYRNTISDLIRFNVYTLPRVRGIQVTALLASLLLGYTAYGSVRALEGPQWARAVSGVVLFLGSVAFVFALGTLASLVAAIPRFRRAAATDRTVTLTDASVVEESAQCRHETKWPGVRKISRTRHAMLIYFSEQCAHIVPKRVFPTSDAADEFYRYAVERQHGKYAA